MTKSFTELVSLQTNPVCKFDCEQASNRNFDKQVHEMIKIMIWKCAKWAASANKVINLSSKMYLQQTLLG